MVRRLVLLALVALLAGTVAITAPAKETHAQATPDQQTAMLNAHNTLRRNVAAAETQRLGRRVVIPDLTWNADAATVATAWANTQLARGIFEHNPQNQYGENIYRESGGQDPAGSLDRAIQGWSSEAANYNWDTNACAPGAVCGHYTQMVWAEATSLGCGMATDGATTHWVCNFAGGGNNGPRPYFPEVNLTGTWTVDNFGSGPGGTLTLTQTGNQVTGTFTYPGPNNCGTITGTFTGTISPLGVIRFTIGESGCGMTGGGGNGRIGIAVDGNSFTGGRVLNGTRAGAAPPPPPANPNPTPAACPNDQFQANYFNNRTLDGAAVLTRCEPTINFATDASPGAGVNVDNFSFRATGRFTFTGGDVAFLARCDDGCRLWVDGNQIIDEWREQGPTEFRATRALTAGLHEIRFDYFENGGGATAQLSWQQAAPQPQPQPQPQPAPAGGPQDNLAAAGTVTVPATVGPMSTAAATDEAGEPKPCGNIGKTVWLRFVATAGGQYTVSTLGSSFDTAVAVYRSAGAATGFGSLTPIDCNDDAADTRQSQLTFTANAGDTIYIQAGGWGGETGDLTVRIAAGAP